MPACQWPEVMLRDALVWTEDDFWTGVEREPNQTLGRVIMMLVHRLFRTPSFHESFPEPKHRKTQHFLEGCDFPWLLDR